MATATSRIVSRSRTSRVRREMAGIVEASAIVAVEISWIRRWPAVKLAVRRTPRARGRMSRLVVSIRMRAGINGVGVPSGRRCAREAEGWLRRPVRRVASHNGKARARFIDSWVVGVKVYGSRPSRLMRRRKIIREVRIKAHLCPFSFSGVISCLVIRLISQSCKVERRPVIHRLPGIGSRRAGNVREIRIRGIPRSEGLEN